VQILSDHLKVDPFARLDESEFSFVVPGGRLGWDLNLVG
jgi:hypothetical protein